MDKVYQSCCKNVRELKSKRRILKQLINQAIREGSEIKLNTLTYMYALLYSSYAEISFLKLIYTPNCFSLNEINEIKKQRNLEEKWKKCMELSFKNLNTNANLGEIANKKLFLKRILKDYIIEPSLMRNKIAHGQWKSCLNTSCDKINTSLTLQIKELDYVRIDILFGVYEKFQQCLEDLIKSPRTHYRDYYPLITELEEFIKKTNTWDIESKKDKIKKSSKYLNFQKRNN